jgi:hypothetical protein
VSAPEHACLLKAVQTRVIHSPQCHNASSTTCRCDKESAAELLSHGADVFARDIHDRTPLHVAAFSGASDVVLLLCKNKSDVHAKDKFG